jgi:hypothetical protein
MAIVGRGSREPSRRAWIPAPDIYLTDDRSLFRVLGEQVVDDQPVVELEDCVSFVTLVVTVRELATLRPVQPASER